MNKAGSIFLILSFIMVGCGSDSHDDEKKNKDDNSIIDKIEENEMTSTDKNDEVKSEDMQDDSASASSKNNSNSTSAASANKSQESNGDSKKSSHSSESSSDQKNPSDTTTPQTTEPKDVTTPVKEWAMSETEMIEYAKKCVVSYKPTSGYGKCEWHDEFGKKNSGWFEATTLKISKTKSQLQDLIKITVDSTLEKTTSQVLDDGKGNIDKEAVYGAKGYLEKVDNEQYKFYVFY